MSYRHRVSIRWRNLRTQYAFALDCTVMMVAFLVLYAICAPYDAPSLKVLGRIFLALAGISAAVAIYGIWFRRHYGPRRSNRK